MTEHSFPLTVFCLQVLRTHLNKKGLACLLQLTFFMCSTTHLEPHGSERRTGFKLLLQAISIFFQYGEGGQKKTQGTSKILLTLLGMQGLITVTYFSMTIEYTIVYDYIESQNKDSL